MLQIFNNENKNKKQTNKGLSCPVIKVVFLHIKQNHSNGCWETKKSNFFESCKLKSIFLRKSGSSK